MQQTRRRSRLTSARLVGGITTIGPGSVLALSLGAKARKRRNSLPLDWRLKGPRRRPLVDGG